jgi:hypothetical protein
MTKRDDNKKSRKLFRAQQVGEEAEGAGDGFGELAVESEGDVGPAAFAELGGDEAAALGSWPGSWVSVGAE